MNCTHCDGHLTNYKKSAPQARKNWHYILCSCGNVMSALFEKDAIIDIQKTPTDSSPSTLKEMYLAKKLFDTAGISVHSYSVDKASDSKTFDEERDLESDVIYADFGSDNKRSILAKIWDFCKAAF